MDAGALVIGRVSNVVADYLSDGSEDEAGSSKEKSGEASNAPEASHSEESSKETGHNSIKEAEEAVEEVPLEVSPELSTPEQVKEEKPVEAVEEEIPIIEPKEENQTVDAKPIEATPEGEKLIN